MLLLDYDGTHVPFAETPELAVPDPELLALLHDVAGRPGTDVHVVSGRTRETLEAWLGALPVGLAWHYRATEPGSGTAQASEFRLHLNTLLGNEPVEVLAGACVIEVRPQGVHKGQIVEPIAQAAPGSLLVALGDDRTDEDLFAALPGGAVAVHVGPGPSGASYRLGGGPREVRRLLRALAPAVARPVALVSPVGQPTRMRAWRDGQTGLCGESARALPESKA